MLKEVKKSERKKITESQATQFIGRSRFTREEEEFINDLIDKKVAAAREGEGKGVAAGGTVVAAVRVIQKPGEHVKKKGGASKEVSKCDQVWDTLKKFVPDAPILELHDALMQIMGEGFFKVETKQTKLKVEVPELTKREKERELLR